MEEAEAFARLAPRFRHALLGRAEDLPLSLSADKLQLAQKCFSAFGLLRPAYAISIIPRGS
jgi:hypothetical protein